MSIEAMKLALEALETVKPYEVVDHDPLAKATQALRQAIEQAEQAQPVAWYDSKSGWTDFHFFKPVRKPSAPDAEWLPLYTAPPPRQPLSDEQISDLWDGHTVPVFGKMGINPIVFARAIEAAHGIKE